MSFCMLITTQGNSLADLVANITIARMGYPVMALSACFGGPMFSMLFRWRVISN